MTSNSKTNLDLSVVKKNELTFVVMNAPTDTNISSYIKELQALEVHTIMRVCEPTYSKDRCVQSGIEVEDYPFDDGAAPPPEIINTWLNIVDVQRAKGKGIAVHCVAGLGRAPVLVVIALVEFAGMEPTEAIQFVRKERKGAINRRQLEYLTSYKRVRKGNSGCACVIS
jgi:protein tyrosine phosphatase type 4A